MSELSAADFSSNNIPVEKKMYRCCSGCTTDKRLLTL